MKRERAARLGILLLLVAIVGTVAKATPLSASQLCAHSTPEVEVLHLELVEKQVDGEVTDAPEAETDRVYLSGHGVLSVFRGDNPRSTAWTVSLVEDEESGND